MAVTVVIDAVTCFRGGNNLSGALSIIASIGTKYGSYATGSHAGCLHGSVVALGVHLYHKVCRIFVDESIAVVIDAVAADFGDGGVDIRILVVTVAVADAEAIAVDI